MSGNDGRLHAPETVVTFTREQVRAVDEAAIEEYGIPGIVLMENAATAIEEVCLELLAEMEAACVLIVAGPGNNGGDGFAVARKLWNRGIDVRVVTWREVGKYEGDAGVNVKIAQRMGISMTVLDRNDVGGSMDHACASKAGSMLLVDALLGTGLDRPVRAPMDQVIAWMNAKREAGARVLAVDIPTGLDCDTGEPLSEACVRADVTVTLAGMKTGLAEDRARAYAGDVFVGDIGVPRELLERLGS